jgi:hypothetical protein
VCDQKTSNKEEAKARYRDMKIQPQWVVTPGKQTNKKTNYHYHGHPHPNRFPAYYISQQYPFFVIRGTDYKSLSDAKDVQEKV